MPRNSQPEPPFESLIRNIRGERVILDSDLARIYGVEARALNQAVKRNANRFPPDFAFKLSNDEAHGLKSQIVISSSPEARSKSEKAGPQNAKSSHGGRRKLPWVFTEHGALMAANILRSERAVQMSVYVVRAFVSQREQLSAKADVLRRLEKIDEKLLEHDEALLIVWGSIKELMQSKPALPPPAPKRRIGFQP